MPDTNPIGESVTIEHLVPAVDAAAAARLTSILAARTPGATGSVELTIDGVAVDLPPSAADAITALLTCLASGRRVSLGPVEELLTTSQAAEILGVSDTYVRRLADAGKLSTELRGTHRRFHLDSVVAYRGQLARRD